MSQYLEPCHWLCVVANHFEHRNFPTHFVSTFQTHVRILPYMYLGAQDKTNVEVMQIFPHLLDQNKVWQSKD